MADKKNNLKMPKFNLTWVYAIIIFTLGYMLLMGGDEAAPYSLKTDYSNFKAYISRGYADSIVVDKGEETATMIVARSHVGAVMKSALKDSTAKVSVTTQIPSVDKLEDFIEVETQAGHFAGKVRYHESSDTWLRILTSFFPIILLVALYFFLFRRMGGGGAGGGGGIFSVGKSKARLFEKGSGLSITFKDVAGQEGAKEEIQEIVAFLKAPGKYTELGGKIPKGALLVGPPGTGKTLLAKAVAGEAGVPFFSMSGSDFVEMFVGVGASRVRDLFAQAKEKAPCIIFIDEIDAVGRARGKNPSMGGNDERENTLNQLLTEMDGFGTNSGVIILAATNRVDILDKALLRAGRFDRQIHVDLPDLQERKAIFGVHLRPIKIDDTVDVEMMARQTPGFSGADIANVCNEAALIAARRNKNAVGKQEFLDAVDRIIGGLEKKSKIMTVAEKHTISIHEAGHATVSWFLEFANPLVKVTIVPRGQALGAAWYMPDERTITTKDQMLDEICATLGGRAAEEIFTGKISSGALNDLETVTKRVYSMVAYLGMSEELYNLSYYNMQEYQFDKPYSDKTAETIDKQVHTIIMEQYRRALDILRSHADGHKTVTDMLMTREVIFANDMEDVFGKRPWVSRAEVLESESAKPSEITADEVETTSTEQPEQPEAQ